MTFLGLGVITSILLTTIILVASNGNPKPTNSHKGGIRDTDTTRIGLPHIIAKIGTRKT